MKRNLLFILVTLLPVVASADEYTDPQSKVVYTYEPGQATASVKAGYEDVQTIGSGYDGELPSYSFSGSPDAEGDIVILDRFTVGAEEYVVTSIGQYAFQETFKNKKIKSVIIPETVTDIRDLAFCSCDSLTSVQLPSGLTQIARGLFQGCSQLVTVNIPSSVKTIDEQAFAGCGSLSNLNLPAGLTFIGKEAFKGTLWYDTQYAEAPNGPFYIDPILFGCKGDKATGDLAIKEGTTCVGYEALYGCYNLTSVTIPPSVVSVNTNAFEYCTGLKAVHITDLAAWCGIKFQWGWDARSSNPLSYANNLFLNGEKVSDIVIPEGVTRIGSYAFDHCDPLTSVTIPDGVTSIGEYAFRKCSNLTSITLPPSIIKIENSAFLWCFKLDAVHISDLAAWCGISLSMNGDSPLYYGAHLYLNDEEVTNLVIPDGVTSISNYAFEKCSYLTSVTFSEGVTSIGESSFDGCSGITYISLPKSLNDIYVSAFAHCSNLRDVYCYAENVPNTRDAFFASPIANATLHVPAGSIDKYKTTSPWSGFGSIVALPQQYFPEGTKWTEIRLDTLKYDSWYSKVDGEWVPNFETIEYRVQGEYGGEGNPYSNDPYKCVYTNSSEWTDSLTLLISEGELNGFPTGILVTVYDNEIDQPLVPSSYPFEWEVGTMIRFKDILAANMTALFPRDLFDFGVVEEIKEAYFGGVRLLKYSDVKGVRMIQGIGVVTWNDGECIFGPLKPYDALPLPHEESRHYRSMLVHFERDGEVLYDVWPEKEAATAVTFTKDQMATIILPTAPDASKGKYYRLDRVENGQIVFEQEKQPRARVPYIIVPSEDFSIDISSLDLEGLQADTVTVGGVSFIGSYVRKELPALTGGDGGGSLYYDIIDTTPDCGFLSTAETGKEAFRIGALRAYLTVNWDDPYNHHGSKSPEDKLDIVLKDDGTGIEQIQSSKFKIQNDGEEVNGKWSNGKCYDLSGRKWSMINGHCSMPKGIYIQNSRKLVK